MSVLTKLFSHPAPAKPDTLPATTTGDPTASADVAAGLPDDLLDYVDDGDPLVHDPGEPPHWAPECGTPAYSTRHHGG